MAPKGIKSCPKGEGADGGLWDTSLRVGYESDREEDRRHNKADSNEASLTQNRRTGVGRDGATAANENTDAFLSTNATTNRRRSPTRSQALYLASRTQTRRWLSSGMSNA